MKIKITFLLVLLPIIISITSCDDLNPAVGREDEILVIADSSEYDQIEGQLLQIFSKVIYTPQPENLFELKRVGLGRLENYSKSKNIIIVAPLNSGSRVSNYISSILDSASLSVVESDSAFVINKYDLWAKNQLVMIITSTSMEKLKYNMLNAHEDLLYNFQTLSDKRLKKSLYSPSYEQEKIEAQFLKDYGWIIYVQADFHLAANDSTDNFVWLRRAINSDMERWIFVHWLENASPTFLHPDSIAMRRNYITERHLRAIDESSFVEIAEDYHTTSEVNFLNRYALMTQGLWQMQDKSMGGPFINYTFYDENSGRIYMLDGSIYAPKYYKKRLIHQVDVLLQSFLTAEELNEDRKEDLLEELE